MWQGGGGVGSAGWGSVCADGADYGMGMRVRKSGTLGKKDLQMSETPIYELLHRVEAFYYGMGEWALDHILTPIAVVLNHILRRLE